MIYLISFLLLVSIAGNIFLFVALKKSFTRMDEYEVFFSELQTRIAQTIQTMKSIDIRGSFESDDEVGGTFKELKSLIEALDIFLVGEEDEQ